MTSLLDRLQHVLPFAHLTDVQPKFEQLQIQLNEALETIKELRDLAASTTAWAEKVADVNHLLMVKVDRLEATAAHFHDDLMRCRIEALDQASEVSIEALWREGIATAGAADCKRPSQVVVDAILELRPYKTISRAFSTQVGIISSH